MGNSRKELQKEYEPVFEEMIEFCHKCNQRLDLVAKDLKPELNIVVFHQTCYTDWFREVKDFGVRTGQKLNPKEIVE